MPLKDAEIRALRAGAAPYNTADGKGLYAETFPNGSKLWRLKYRLAGKEKRLALGAYPEIPLAEARRRRDAARTQIDQGIDPGLERKREKLFKEFRQLTGPDGYVFPALHTSRRPMSENTVNAAFRRLGLANRARTS